MNYFLRCFSRGGFRASICIYLQICFSFRLCAELCEVRIPYSNLSLARFFDYWCIFGCFNNRWSWCKYVVEAVETFLWSFYLRFFLCQFELQWWFCPWYWLTNIGMGKESRFFIWVVSLSFHCLLDQLVLVYFHFYVAAFIIVPFVFCDELVPFDSLQT